MFGSSTCHWTVLKFFVLTVSCVGISGGFYADGDSPYDDLLPHVNRRNSFRGSLLRTLINMDREKEEEENAVNDVMETETVVRKINGYESVKGTRYVNS